MIKNPPANAGDIERCGFNPRIPWRKACNPLQYSCLEKPMDRGAWQTTIHRVIVGHNWGDLAWMHAHKAWCIFYQYVLEQSLEYDIKQESKSSNPKKQTLGLKIGGKCDSQIVRPVFLIYVHMATVHYASTEMTYWGLIPRCCWSILTEWWGYLGCTTVQSLLQRAQRPGG